MSTSKGAIMDLVAHGVQDLPLIGNPQMTYFKQVFKRHTNFARNSIQVTLDGGFSFGTKLTCKIPRSGDLVENLLLELDFPALTASGSDSQHEISYIENVGYAAIDYVEFKIGGEPIDKQYGEWMYIWSQLSNNYDRRQTLNYMTKGDAQNGPFTAYIPLQLWFCKDIANALPLIALQYHEVELDIQLKPLSELYNFGDINYYNLTNEVSLGGGNYQYTKSTGLDFVNDINGKKLVQSDGTEFTITFVDANTITLDGQVTDTTEVYITHTYIITNPSVQYTDIRLFADYVFLDIYEQKHFAKMEHRYLIEQLQFSENNSINANTNALNMKLTFNLPIKELVWIKQIDANKINNKQLNFSSTPDPYYEVATDDITYFTFSYNNEERIAERKGEYFRLIQPLNHHTNIPRNEYIYLYSFAYKPEELQPSGTSNLSKIDKVNFHFKFRTNHRAGNIRVYGLNYNVLRIEKGMAGIAFVN